MHLHRKTRCLPAKRGPSNASVQGPGFLKIKAAFEKEFYK